MNYSLEEFEVSSSDGIHTLKGEIYKPKDGKILGIVQLSHGMCDHIGRYLQLAEYLTDRGFVFAGHSHLGHGKTADTQDELGFFSERGGVDFLVQDVHRVNKALREILGDISIIILGHSMGSFIARIYLERYPCEINGAIILASSGPNRIINAGKLLVCAMSAVIGKKHRSKLVRKLASFGYNKRFPKEEGKNAWLTRDGVLAEQKLLDPYANFTFTLSGYNDLFTLVKTANSKNWFDSYPKSLPTFIASGDMDPVGDFGKGVRRVYDELLQRGHTALSIKIYKNARHELFNETNREEFFADIVNWLGGIIL